MGDSGEYDARESVYKNEMLAHMRTAIGELKPDFREIIVMKHLDEMSYKDIAGTLDIPIGTVMSRLYHARKALAKLMEKHRA